MVYSQLKLLCVILCVCICVLHDRTLGKYVPSLQMIFHKGHCWESLGSNMLRGHQSYN